MDAYGDDGVAELIKTLLADPKLPHLFATQDYLRRYVVHITPNADERARLLAAVPEVWRQYRKFWSRAHAWERRSSRRYG